MHHSHHRLYLRVVLAIYFVLGLVKLFHHELWRDEWRAWMIARASDSFGGLIHDLRFDGHPILWYVPLYALSRLTDNPLAMMCFHLLVATAALYVVLRFAPFTPLQKTLFAFGYYPFFEYSTISRNYALGFLFLTVALVFLRRRPVNSIALAVALALMIQCSVYGAVVATAVAVAYVAHRVFGNAEGNEDPPRRLAVSGAILVIGYLGSLAMMLPGPGSRYDMWTEFGPDDRMQTVVGFDRICQTLEVVWTGYFPVPTPSYQYWNTNILDSVPTLQTLLALACILLVVLALSRRLVPFVLVLSGSGAILLFTYTYFHGSARHNGHLFLLLIGAFWLAQGSASLPAGTGIWSRWTRACDGCRGRMLTTLLAVNLVAGLWVSVQDVVQPFTAADEAARFIEEEYPDLPIVGSVDSCISPIAGILNRPVFYVENRELRAVNSQDPDKLSEGGFGLNTAVIVNQVASTAVTQNTDVILVLSSGYGLKSEDFTIPLNYSALENVMNCRFRLVAEFESSTVTNEVYKIYLASCFTGR